MDLLTINRDSVLELGDLQPDPAVPLNSTEPFS